MSWQIRLRNGGVDINDEMSDALYELVFAAEPSLYQEWITIEPLTDEALKAARDRVIEASRGS